jgi:hypothetical protein
MFPNSMPVWSWTSRLNCSTEGLVTAEHSPDAGPCFRVRDPISRYAQQPADPAILLQVRRRHGLRGVPGQLSLGGRRWGAGSG